jgi:hypothetical protein
MENKKARGPRGATRACEKRATRCALRSFVCLDCGRGPVAASGGTRTWRSAAATIGDRKLCRVPMRQCVARARYRQISHHRYAPHRLRLISVRALTRVHSRKKEKPGALARSGRSEDLQRPKAVCYHCPDERGSRHCVRTAGLESKDPWVGLRHAQKAISPRSRFSVSVARSRSRCPSPSSRGAECAPIVRQPSRKHYVNDIPGCAIATRTGSASAVTSGDHGASVRACRRMCLLPRVEYDYSARSRQAASLLDAGLRIAGGRTCKRQGLYPY